VHRLAPTDPALLELFRRADVFCLPTRGDAVPLSVVEAMACGAAVVASDVGGVPEVVADGETGLLVHYDGGDPGAFEAALADGVNRLVRDPELARRLGAAGRRRAIEHFSWSRIAEQTLDLYRSLV
jgi:alpha-maltose-1-phosphate synthase